MICSHNSMTFVHAKNPIINYLFRWLWKCQRRGIGAQIKAGVKCFDLRVVCHPHNSGQFRFAHGLADLDVYFSVHETIRHIERAGGLFRIVIERGGYTYDDLQTLINTFTPHGNCIGIWAKRGWRHLWANPDFANLVIEDLSYTPFHTDKPWYRQLGSLLHLTTPYKWALKHNRAFTPAEIDDTRKLIVVDFVDVVKLS